jgi:DNA-binding NarL/FixJ family response regulator
MTKENKKTTIIIVEDDPITVDRLSATVSAHQGCEVVAVENTLKSAIKIVRELEPDIVLVDLGLPDGSGLELIRIIDQEELHSKPMVVSVFEDDRNIIQAINAGACGYILKDDSTIDIADAIDIVLNNGAPISPVIARHILNVFSTVESPNIELDQKIKDLTDREKGILIGISKGYTNKEIADQEFISYHTVTTHIKHIYRKLKVRSRVEATRLALSSGLVDSI